MLGWARLSRSGAWWGGGWVGEKAENKAKAQYSTEINPSKLLAELQHSAWLGKTFPGGRLGGRLGGWVGGEKLGKRLISASWSLKLAELGNFELFIILFTIELTVSNQKQHNLVYQCI